MERGEMIGVERGAPIYGIQVRGIILLALCIQHV